MKGEGYSLGKVVALLEFCHCWLPVGTVCARRGITGFMWGRRAPAGALLLVGHQELQHGRPHNDGDQQLGDGSQDMALPWDAPL